MIADFQASLQVAAVKVTPALQREKAKGKRNATGRGRGRGKGGLKKGRSKISRRRSIAKFGKSASCEPEAHDEWEEVAEKPVRAKAKAKAKGKAGKAKAAKPAEPLPAESGLDDDEPAEEAKGKRRRSKAKDDGQGHDKQRHLYLDPSSSKWIYEVLEDQEFGCSNCRCIFAGCAMCRKPTFLGRSANLIAQTMEYKNALLVCDGLLTTKEQARRLQLTNKARKTKASTE